MYSPFTGFLDVMVLTWQVEHELEMGCRVEAPSESAEIGPGGQQSQHVIAPFWFFEAFYGINSSDFCLVILVGYKDWFRKE
jgi:hypothetical protein